MDRGAEHSTPNTHSMGKQYQHSEAEHGMSNSAITHPGKSDQHLENYSAQLDTYPRTTEQYSEHIQNKPITKDQELRELTDKLAQKDQEVDDIRRLWKGTARELGKYQARGKVRDQVTDPELIQKARQIQYNVRNFTCQHFGDQLNSGKSVQNSWQCLQKDLEASPDFLDACIHSSVKRPMLVNAFLWAFLMNDIFGRFWWGGGRVHIGMEYLTDTLKRKRSYVIYPLNDSNDFQ